MIGTEDYKISLAITLAAYFNNTVGTIKASNQRQINYLAKFLADFDCFLVK